MKDEELENREFLTFFFICGSYLDPDPDPAVQNQCGSGFTTLQLAPEITCAENHVFFYKCKMTYGIFVRLSSLVT